MKIKSQTAWHSSYEENNYGELFYALVRIYQPKKVVEIGTLAGYSAYHMARALKANGHGTLDCYDLWENCLYNFGIDFTFKSVAEDNLRDYQDIIRLELRDAVGIDKKYKTVDILHLDIDNDGVILDKIIPAWIDKVKFLIIIEGGSTARDDLDKDINYKKMPVSEWLGGLDNNQADNLKKIVPEKLDKTGQYVVIEGDYRYKKKPIAKWLLDYSKNRKDIEYFTFEPFPSLTIIRKKV